MVATYHVRFPPIAHMAELIDVPPMKWRLALPFIALTNGTAAHAVKAPDCSGPDHWAANMALSALQTDGDIRNEAVDFDRVTSKTLVSEHIGKDLWRQVFRVTVPLKAGKRVEAIVVSDASSDECSMSDPQVFLIAKKL